MEGDTVNDGKRPRNGNWTAIETDILRELCIKYSSILNAAFGSNVTAKRKGELWAEITAKVNQAQKEMLIKNGDGMCGFSGRSVEQVRKKWKNIRTSAVSCV